MSESVQEGRQDRIVDLASRTERLLNVIYQFAAGNFSVHAEQSPYDDALDGIALGLNMLAEEFCATAVSKDYLDCVIASMNDGVAVTNTQGMIDIANAKLGQLAGCSESELVGSSADQLFLESESIVKTLLDGPSSHQEVCLPSREEKALLFQSMFQLPFYVIGTMKRPGWFLLLGT